MTGNSPQLTRRRRRLSFRLRTLLIITALLAPFCAWVGSERWHSWTELRIADELMLERQDKTKAYLGGFLFEFVGPFDDLDVPTDQQGGWRKLARKALGPRVDGVTLGMREKRAPAVFAKLAECKRLRRLTIISPITKLSPVAELTSLEVLWLSSIETDDLSPLVGLTKLKKLSLGGTDVSEEQLRALKAALPNCMITTYGKDGTGFVDGARQP